MRNKYTSFLLLTCYLLLTMGCTALTTKETPPPRKEIPLEEAIPASVYPESFTMNQRLILTIGDKEFDFIGYLTANQKSGFRAMAFGEMGGKVFDLAFGDGKAEIFKMPEQMPLRPVLEGVIGDIRHLYFQPDFKEAFQIKDATGKSFFIILRDTTEQTEYHYSADRELFHSKHLSENTVVRETKYLDYKLFPGWHKPLPSRIRLVNHRWNYSLDITLMKITEGVRTQKVTMQK